MGLQFKELVVRKEISIAELKDKILAVDSMNLLYQFLTTIRSPSGEVFTDAKGHVTSHLIGLFHRTTALMEQGLKLAFVFDGQPPAIKQKTWEKRKEAKQEAASKLKKAEEGGDWESVKKFAARTSILTKEMVRDAQEVLLALGLPVIQAPSEGEAQTAYMVKKGNAYASISQDYDNLIFGCPRLIRNLSLEGKRKKPGTLAYEKIKPEIIILQDVLRELKLTNDQLIILAILVGTDYNPGGIKGIGPKTGLKLVREFANDFRELFAKVEWTKHCPDQPWKEIFDTIKNIPVTDKFILEWKKIDEKKLIHLLVEEHNFGEGKVRQKLMRLQEMQKQFAQKGLGNYF